MLKIYTKNQNVIDFIKQNMPESADTCTFENINRIEIIMNDECSIVDVEKTKAKGEMVCEKLNDMCSINIK